MLFTDTFQMYPYLSNVPIYGIVAYHIFRRLLVANGLNFLYVLVETVLLCLTIHHQFNYTMKMYEIKGKQTYNKLQKHTRIGYISKHFNKFSKFNKNIKEPVLSSSPSLDARERDYRA